jgi:hypothetical protein
MEYDYFEDLISCIVVTHNNGFAQFLLIIRLNESCH